jgi:hypothetical protein
MDEDWSMRIPKALKKAILQEVMIMGKNIQKFRKEKE